VIAVCCEFMFYRMIEEVIDGNVSCSWFSVYVNFQFICFPSNVQIQEIYLCNVFVCWVELYAVVWMLFMYLCIESAVVCVVSYIMNMSSTYRV
jgi:hypothetical protein